MPRVLPAPRPLPAAALLQLIWLASPALPVGSFSYSEGLEPAVEAGLLPDEAAATAWLLCQLRLQQQRSELPLLACAVKAWQRHDLARITELNDWVLATRETRELRQQTEQMGRSMADWQQKRRPDDPRCAQLVALPPAPGWPVAFALAAADTGAPLRELLLAFGFGWCEAMVQAALKAVPLGQSAGQRRLGQLADALPAVVDVALALAAQGDGARQSFSPRLAILSAQHEAQYSRLFRS